LAAKIAPEIDGIVREEPPGGPPFQPAAYLDNLIEKLSRVASHPDKPLSGDI
jgi:hypothetical protein